MTEIAAPMILPVGRYTGEFHPAVGAPVKYHSLSVGRLAVALEDPQVFAAWVAAHRPADWPDGRPWDREAVLDAAARLAVTGPERILADLLEDGLLVEFDPGSDDAVGFARAHRVLPLMVPLGNSSDDPLRYGIGLFGAEPVLRLPALAHDVWQWSGIGGSLWEVCEILADAGTRAEVSDEREHDPRYVLGEFLAALPALIGSAAACLDEARLA